MTEKRNKPVKKDINGILLLDKPTGIGSNKILQQVKHLFQAKKAGFVGTLDPLATGMLPVCFGRFTKLSDVLLAKDKCYRATIKLGVQTASADSEGEIIAEQEVPKFDRQTAEKVYATFLGEIQQIPPMFSALKHQGQPLYKLARAGKTIKREPRVVTIYRIELLRAGAHELEVEVVCSKGTYIRVLAEDIAKKLGTLGHIIALRRTYCAGFSEQDLVSVDEVIAAVAAGEADRLLIQMTNPSHRL